MLLGSLQGFLLSFLFLVNHQFKKKSNRWLAILIFTISLQNISNGLIDIGHNQIEYYPLSWTLLIPVCIYYFIQYLIEPDYKISRLEYLFFLPFIVQLLFKVIVFGIYLIDFETIEIAQFAYLLLTRSFEVLAVIVSFGVLVLSIKKLNNYEARLMNNFSEIENKTLKWLKNILMITFVLWLLWAISFAITILYTPQITMCYLSWIGIAFMIYWIAYSLLIRRYIFEDVQIQQESFKILKPELSDKSEIHYKNLLHLMEVEKLYRLPDLNMNVLAEKTGLSKGYLSKIINQKEGKNFFELVNNYRVKEAQEKIKDPNFSHYTLLGIGLDVGFKSKSTFNAVFKKLTGKTPSAYKKGKG